MSLRAGRRFVSVLPVCVVLVCAARLDAASITVGSASAVPGGIVKIPLTFSGGGELVTAGVVLSVPQGLTFLSVDAGPIAGGRTFAGSGDSGYVAAQIYSTDPATLNVAIPDGLFATVTFAVASNASGVLPLIPNPQADLGNHIDTGAVVMIDVNTATVTVACGTPGAPSFTSGPATLTAGQNYAARWSAAPGLSSTGSYVVETSASASFATIASTLTTPNTEAIVPTAVADTDSSLFLRVRAVQNDCGMVGPNSAPVVLTVRALPETFAATAMSLSLSGTVGGASSVGTAVFRNVGGRSGAISFSLSNGSFDVAPSVLTLAPGQEGSVTITARASALTTPAILQAELIGSSRGRAIDLPITLSVAPASTNSRAGTRLQVTPLTVEVSGPAGANPASQTVHLTVQPAGVGPLYLSAAISPGGSWLMPPPELASAVPASNELTLTLAIDRARRSADDVVPPLATLLTLTPVGGSAADAVVIQVRDVEPSPIAAGNDRPAMTSPPGNSSFIVPSTVRAEGKGGAVFTSDGWLKNESSADVPADFYFTPDGANGLSDGGVKKTTQAIPAGTTLRLADLVSSIFQASGVSGQVEVRAGTPGSLSLRTSVEAVTGGDATSRYGTEIPVVAYGSGVGRNDGELVLPGVDDDADRRANLILTETLGANATVKIAVIDANGQPVGETTKDVPAYGKVQINGLVQAVEPGAALTGGWAAVSVTAGSGRVVPIVTVIDNRSNSFSAIRGQNTRESAPASRPRGASAAPRPLASAAPTSLILPSAARLTGAANTRFTTRVAMVNGTAQPASLTMTYNYVDVADGNKQKSASVPVVIPPRGSLPPAVGNDVIAALFGLTGPTFGWMAVTGDVRRVVATTAVSAQVDPNDPSKGVKTAQVGGLFSDSGGVMALSAEERRFAGAEKSVQRRTNLALVETSGQPASVTLRLYAADGLKLAEKSFALAPDQYLQITDVFGSNGLELGDGPFQNVELSAQVTAGGGRVVGVASVNDNLSRNPQLFVLQPAGPGSATIGF